MFMNKIRKNGGQSGIRTRGTLSRTHTFQACAFNHSATCPNEAAISAVLDLTTRPGFRARIYTEVFPYSNPPRRFFRHFVTLSSSGNIETVISLNYVIPERT
jgi:hypothetical protein